MSYRARRGKWTFRYEPGEYEQGMLERRQRMRDEDVAAFCHAWLCGKAVTWMVGQFKSETGGRLHWLMLYSHARRLEQQGILPEGTGKEPRARWSASGHRLAASDTDVQSDRVIRAHMGRPPGSYKRLSVTPARPGETWQAAKARREQAEAEELVPVREAAEGRQQPAEPEDARPAPPTPEEIARLRRSVAAIYGEDQDEGQAHGTGHQDAGREDRSGQPGTAGASGGGAGER